MVALAVHVDGVAEGLRQPLPDGPSLHHAQAVPDHKAAGSLVGRMEEHGTEEGMIPLQPADHRVALADIGIAGAVGVEG